MAKKPSRCHPVGGETIGLYLAGFGHFRLRCRRCRHTAIASENNQFSRFRPLTNVGKNMILRDASDSFVAVSATFDDRMATLSSGSDLQHGASVFCSNRSRKMYCFELCLCCPRGALNTSRRSFATSTGCEFQSGYAVASVFRRNAVWTAPPRRTSRTASLARLTSTVDGRRYLRSTALVVPPVHRSTLGDRAFRVAASRAHVEQSAVGRPRYTIASRFPTRAPDISVHALLT